MFRRTKMIHWSQSLSDIELETGVLSRNSNAIHVAGVPMTYLERHYYSTT